MFHRFRLTGKHFSRGLPTIGRDVKDDVRELSTLVERLCDTCRMIVRQVSKVPERHLLRLNRRPTATAAGVGCAAAICRPQPSRQGLLRAETAGGMAFSSKKIK
jgi:hypothetical protein